MPSWRISSRPAEFQTTLACYGDPIAAACFGITCQGVVRDAVGVDDGTFERGLAAPIANTDILSAAILRIIRDAT